MPATYASHSRGSGMSTSSAAGILPLSLYGYFDWYPSGMTTCSTDQIDSMPQRSALVAMAVAPSGPANGPVLANMIPNFMMVPV
jgi:hypothetical protein